ncbi:unnamed protein product, partial [Symbiodinium necroappetens]
MRKCISYKPMIHPGPRGSSRRSRTWRQRLGGDEDQEGSYHYRTQEDATRVPGKAQQSCPYVADSKGRNANAIVEDRGVGAYCEDQPDYAIQPFERGRQGKPYEKSIKDGETTLGTPNETNTDPNDAELDERYQNRLEQYNHTNYPAGQP